MSQIEASKPKNIKNVYYTLYGNVFYDDTAK